MLKLNQLSALALFSIVSATSLAAQDHAEPKFRADVPTSIQTPDTVETRIGTLKFSDGLPDQDTVRKVYDNIDFSRGVEAFLSGMPAASVYALCQGLEDAGAVKTRASALRRT